MPGCRTTCFRSEIGAPDALFDALKNVERLQAALVQIAIVCTDNMDRDCNHRMALDFVRQIANDELPKD